MQQSIDSRAAFECSWVSPDRDGAPPGDHLLTVRGVPESPVRWTSETWPVLIRPDTDAGKRLGANCLRPGLLLIERASDTQGHPVLEHRVTVPTDGRRAGDALPLEALSLFGGPRRR